MNFREGMRRLGIVLGAAGAIFGGTFGYAPAQQTWEARSRADRFDKWASSPAIQKEASDLREAVRKSWFAKNAPPEDRQKYNSLREDGRHGIDEFTLSPDGEISSVKLLTGETLYRMEKPPIFDYLSLPLSVVIGFIIPWGLLRLLTWIGAGFFVKQ